jgi:hypothetical protein
MTIPFAGSMILFEIDSNRVPAYPAECNPPRAIDTDSVTLRISMKGVEPITRYIHIFGPFGHHQGIEQPQETLKLILPYVAGFTGFQEFLKPFMPERLYHARKL